MMLLDINTQTGSVIEARKPHLEIVYKENKKQEIIDLTSQMIANSMIGT